MGNRTVHINKKPAKVLHEFDVFWLAWDCDSKGYIVEQDGEVFPVLTSHGTPYRAKKENLEDRIKEYKKAVEDTELALEFLKEYSK